MPEGRRCAPHMDIDRICAYFEGCSKIKNDDVLERITQEGIHVQKCSLAHPRMMDLRPRVVVVQ